MNFKNNFDFLRLIFAIFVLITHSYPLSGFEENDILSQLTNGHFSFSYIGVKGFFIISGYLIFQSLIRSKSLIDFYWKRFLRLFPALIFLLFLTLLLAPIIYESPIKYLQNKQVYSYFFKNIMLYRLQYSIQGVFDKNIYGSAINGSLWTICYEFTMYILLSILFFVKSNKMVLKILTILIFVLFTMNFCFFKSNFAFNFYQLESKYLYELGAFFLAGTILALFNFSEFKHHRMLVFISIIILILSELFLKDVFLIRVLTFSIIIIGFGLQSTKYLNNISEKIGDLSYGIYIYGFPIQQTIMYYFNCNPIQLMLLSITISIVFAYFSWHLIEKNALKLKSINFTKKNNSDNSKCLL